jgi:hypothetical protein
MFIEFSWKVSEYLQITDPWCVTAREPWDVSKEKVLQPTSAA